MTFTDKDRIKGGLRVAQLRGKEWMSKIGKKGRRKQLREAKRLKASRSNDL